MRSSDWSSDVCSSDLFIILMDIPAEFEDRFNHIYDTDHLTHMMHVPGNIRCDRYRLDWSDVPGMLKYLAVYEIADPELPRNAEWQKHGKLGAWASEMRDRVTTRRNGVFRQIAAHRAAPAPADSPPARDCIYFLQQAVPATFDERFNQLYDQEQIPLLLERMDERRVGKEDVSTCSTRWSPVHLQKQQNINKKH